MRHGWAGYGIFWAIIEKLRDANGYRWSSQAEAGLKHGLSDAQATLEQIGNVIETLKEVDLLTVSGDGYLYSKSLTRRMESWNSKRVALSDAGRKGGKKSVESRLSEAQARLKPGSSQASNLASSKASSQAQAIREDKRREDKRREDNIIINEIKEKDVFVFVDDNLNIEKEAPPIIAGNVSKRYINTNKNGKIARWLTEYLSIHPKKVKVFLVEQLWFEIFSNPSLTDEDAAELHKKIITALKSKKDKHPRDDPEYKFFPAADTYLKDGRWMDEVETRQPETIKEQAARMKKKYDEDEAAKAVKGVV